MRSPYLDELVVLKRDMPELGLRFGDVGRVRDRWPSVPQPLYDVEFHCQPIDRDVRVVVSEDQIQVAPLSPFDPQPEDGRSLYF